MVTPNNNIVRDRYISELVELANLSMNDELIISDSSEVNELFRTKKMLVQTLVNVLAAHAGGVNVRGNLLETNSQAQDFIFGKDQFRPGDGTVGSAALDVDTAGKIQGFIVALGLEDFFTNGIRDIEVAGDAGHLTITRNNGTMYELDLDHGHPGPTPATATVTYGLNGAVTNTAQATAGVRTGMAFPVASIGNYYEIRLPDGWTISALYETHSQFNVLSGFTKDPSAQIWVTKAFVKAVEASSYEIVIREI